MKLKHSDTRTMYKCPHATKQERCGKLFGQVKNFIYHYITQHGKNRAEAKRVAGIAGNNLEKVEMSNKGEHIEIVEERDAVLATSSNTTTEAMNLRSSKSKKLQNKKHIIESIEIPARKESNVVKQMDLMGLTYNENENANDSLNIMQSVIDLSTTVCIESCMNGNLENLGSNNTVVENSTDISRAENELPLDLCVRDTQENNSNETDAENPNDIPQAENELPLNLCIRNTQDANDRLISTKRRFNILLPLDLTTKGKETNIVETSEPTQQTGI